MKARGALLGLLLLAGCHLEIKNDAAPPQAAGGSSGKAQGGAAGAQAGSPAAGAAGASPQGGAGTGAGAGGGATGQAGAGLGSCMGVPATGACQDASTVLICLSPSEPDGQTYVSKQTCPAGWSCQQDAEGARCVNPNPCTLGDTRCGNNSTLESCTPGGWVSQACSPGLCRAAAGEPASCVFEEGSSQSFPLQGRLLYEFRNPKADLTGLEAADTDGAYSVLIAAWNGTTYLGGAGTDAEGYYSLSLTEPPGPETRLFAFPMAFDPATNQPLAAVAYPPEGTPDGSESPGYWSFSFPSALAAGATTVPDWTITEAQGSGAIWVFQWLAYSLTWLQNEYPAVSQTPIVAYWQPGVSFSCGSCAYPPGYVQTQVSLGNGNSDYFGARIQISGSATAPQHWMRSILTHEMGHYMMGAYSRQPKEAAPHTFQMVTKPGMAYSEGWATFWGQVLLSVDQLDPVHFSVGSSGTFWHFNIDQDTASTSIPLADPQGAISQPICEALVGSVLWHLWAPGGKGGTYGNAGTSPIMEAFASKRLRDASLDRGYSAADLLDFADAFGCASKAQGQALETIAQEHGYPFHPADEVCAP